MTVPVWLHVFVDVPAESVQTALRFWSAATGWEAGAPWPGRPEFTSLEPADGSAYVHVQGTGGPPRVHLDLAVDDLDTERDRLVGLGATAGTRMDAGQVMASPGGLPFCLRHEPWPKRRPGPVTWPDGDRNHRSRLTQLCIDAPERYADLERDFWRETTGWRYRPSGAAEFDGKLFPPDGGPVQILLQRLGGDDGGDDGHSDRGDRTRAHIDLDTDDRDAEVQRLVGLGARLVGPGRGWVVLEDPVGLPFCVTVQNRELAS